MHTTSTLKRHAALLDRMAGTLGIDLEESAMRGDLPPADIADAVLKCVSCADPAHCAQWLDTQADHANTTPGYCRNAELFQKLGDLATVEDG